MARRKNTGLGDARRGIPDTGTRSFTPILPTQVGILLELLDRKYGITDRAPIRDKIVDILLELPLGGPLVSDEVVQLLDQLAAAEASDDRGAAFIGVGVDQFRQQLPAAPKKKRDTPALKAHKKALSKGFKEANSKLRKNNGELRKGKTQSDVAKMAQKIAKAAKPAARKTKKSIGTRKGQVRKTARRAFKR